MPGSETTSMRRTSPNDRTSAASSAIRPGPKTIRVGQVKSKGGMEEAMNDE